MPIPVFREYGLLPTAKSGLSPALYCVGGSLFDSIPALVHSPQAQLAKQPYTNWSVAAMLVSQEAKHPVTKLRDQINHGVHAPSSELGKLTGDRHEEWYTIPPSSSLPRYTKGQHTVLPNISYVLRGSGGERHLSSAVHPNCCASCGCLYPLGSGTESCACQAIFSAEPSIYSVVCEPLSHWIAQYLWKVTTSGMSLPSAFVGSCAKEQEISSLSVLAESISSLLLSTLLQPSGIVLSLHYIARLPAYIGPCAPDLYHHSTASQFRDTLISSDATLHDTPVTRALYASFKLFVVGAILSNKVLDDHVFTLKTWHEISGIPLAVLNKLEWLSLDILSHDLYLDPVSWREWVNTLQRYHLSLASNFSTPRHHEGTSHRIVRCMLDGLWHDQSPAVTPGLLVDPVFLGIESRRNRKASSHNLQDRFPYDGFELDEEGPLREEYLPKRRSPHWADEAHPSSRPSAGFASSAVRYDVDVDFQTTCHTEAAFTSIWPTTPGPVMLEKPHKEHHIFNADGVDNSSALPHFMFEPTGGVDSARCTTLCEQYLARSQFAPWIVA